MTMIIIMFIVLATGTMLINYNCNTFVVEYTGSHGQDSILLGNVGSNK
jgi:hypothetical protein